MKVHQRNAYPLRMEENLELFMKDQAAKNERSLNAQLNFALKRFMEEESRCENKAAYK